MNRVAPACRPGRSARNRSTGSSSGPLPRPSPAPRSRCGVAGNAVAAAVAVLLLSGCAATLANESQVEETIGRATLRDIVSEVPEILGASGFTIHDRQRTSRLVTYETDWMYRAPFDDEADRGARAARTRLIVSARVSAGNTYSVRARAENEVQGVPGAADLGGTDWSRIPATEMYEAFARDIFLKIKLRVDAGVRVRR